MHVQELSIDDLSSWFYTIDTEEQILSLILAAKLDDISSVAEIIEESVVFDAILGRYVALIIFIDNFNGVFDFQHGFGYHSLARGIFFANSGKRKSIPIHKILNTAKDLEHLDSELSSKVRDILSEKNSRFVPEICRYLEIDPGLLPCVITMIKGHDEIVVHSFGVSDFRSELLDYFSKLRSIGEKFERIEILSQHTIDEMARIVAMHSAWTSEIDKRRKELRKNVGRVSKYSSVKPGDIRAFSEAFVSLDISFETKEREYYPNLLVSEASIEFARKLNILPTLRLIHDLDSKRTALLLNAQKPIDSHLIDQFDNEIATIGAILEEIRRFSSSTPVKSPRKLQRPPESSLTDFEKAERVNTLVDMSAKLLGFIKYFIPLVP